jgi:hypothetical protein
VNFVWLDAQMEENSNLCQATIMLAYSYFSKEFIFMIVFGSQNNPKKAVPFVIVLQKGG